jgi:hypothetical protein
MLALIASAGIPLMHSKKTKRKGSDGLKAISAVYKQTTASNELCGNIACPR